MSNSVDDISDKEVLHKLQDLGLTDKEARVYIALLPLQNTGSSKLIRATGLHGQFVYTALERLEKLGLAKHAIQNGRKKFTANGPLKLLSLVEEKKLAATTLVRELQTRFTSPKSQDFEVYQGESAFIEHEFSLLREAPEGSIIDVIGAGGNNYMETMGSDMDQYEKIRKSKNIKIRYLSSPAQGPYLQIMAQNRANFEYKLFPNLQNGLVDTDIWSDRVTINIFGSPRMSFMIKSAEIAASYKQFFESLWSASL